MEVGIVDVPALYELLMYQHWCCNLCNKNLTKKLGVYILQADERKPVGASLDESAPVCCSSTLMLIMIQLFE
jgi:hypothetical protein